MGPIAQALDTAHSQGILHRDIKPANILLDAGGNPELADFGIAKVLEATTRFTRTSQQIGTSESMTPEQAMGSDLDRRSDLYALAVVIFQMLLGQVPYRANTAAATLMAHANRPVPTATAVDSGIEPGLDGFFTKALAKQPRDKFPSAMALVGALTAISGESNDTIVEASDPQVSGSTTLEQARVLAIRHARDNTAFYGPRYEGATWCGR